MRKRGHGRDCCRCTESAVMAMMNTPARAVGKLTVNLLKKHCPQCPHLTQYHQPGTSLDPRHFQD